MNVKIDGRRERAVAAEVLCAAGAASGWRRRGELGAVVRGGGAAGAAGVEERDVAGDGVRTAGLRAFSCGYVGASDGYQDLMRDMQMSWYFGQALDGNIAVMGEIDVARHREFTDRRSRWARGTTRRCRR